MYVRRPVWAQVNLEISLNNFHWEIISAINLKDLKLLLIRFKNYQKQVIFFITFNTIHVWK